MQRIMSASFVLSKWLGSASKISVEQILQKRTQEEFRNRRTKIICTMGPACWDVDTLVQMMDCGMTVARLNFSHGDHESHAKTVKNLEEAMHKSSKKVALMLDTKGPEIRTGLLKDGKNIDLHAGQTLRITTDYDFVGDNECISCSYPKLPSSVKAGGTILMADGSVTLSVLECHDQHVVTRVLNNATIGEKKNMNLPGVKVELPVCGPQEKRDVVQFAIPHSCHFIAASFVQSAEDVKEFRACLGERANDIKIISKIENVEGIINFDQILEESDGIMVARGDMGMEIPPEKVFLAQKLMIAKCNVAGKPVVTATQMLESMIKNPRPTRAEVSDVANAVIDGTDCVMLSGESANGAFPVDAVKVLARTCLEAESCLDYHAIFQAMCAAVPRPMRIDEGVCCSAVETAASVDAKLIIVLTETGHTARLVAKYKPNQRIFALSSNEVVVRHLRVTRGVISRTVSTLSPGVAVVAEAMKPAKALGLVDSGDNVVAIHGTLEGQTGATNMMRIVQVE